MMDSMMNRMMESVVRVYVVGHKTIKILLVMSGEHTSNGYSHDAEDDG